MVSHALTNLRKHLMTQLSTIYRISPRRIRKALRISGKHRIKIGKQFMEGSVPPDTRVALGFMATVIVT
jgi:endonuclease III-like uncharacterized protein